MKRVFIVLLAAAMLFSLGACGASDRFGTTADNTNPPDSGVTPTEGGADTEPAQSGTRIVTDMWEREVEIPETVETIICLGSGAPRIAAYLNAMDMLVGAEDYVKDGVTVRRDYNPVYYDLLIQLPFVGSGGGSGQNNGYPEEIITVAPDVILAGFDLEAADELQAQTGIPVVSVRHTTGLAPESFYQAMRVFAEVIGAQERCEMLLSYVDSMLADLDARTADVPEEEKLLAYAGAVTWNGRRGFGGTYSKFGIFDAINARNAAENEGIEGFYEEDFESVLVWNPEVIFLDPGNMDLVNEEYSANPDYFNALSAVQNGRIYSMPAFNYAGTNFTYAFMDAYYAGTVLYPQQFADIDIAEKSAEILTTFLGEDTYDIMAEGGLYYGAITIGE